jgi:hypothetical protein
MAEIKVIDSNIKHPYLEKLKDTLVTQKRMKECLEKRLVLISTDWANKNEYEKNEIEITKIKTQGEIDVLKRVIDEKENYFIKYMQGFIVDMEEVEKEYQNILNKAKIKATTNTEMTNLLGSVNWKAVEEFVDVKIHLYKRLKDMLK